MIHPITSFFSQKNISGVIHPGCKIAVTVRKGRIFVTTTDFRHCLCGISPVEAPWLVKQVFKVKGLRVRDMHYFAIFNDLSFKITLDPDHESQKYPSDISVYVLLLRLLLWA